MMQQPAHDGKGNFIFTVQAIIQSLIVRGDFRTPSYRESFMYGTKFSLKSSSSDIFISKWSPGCSGITSYVKWKACNGRTEVVAALSLRIQAFWDLNLRGGWVVLVVARERRNYGFEGQTASALKMALKSFETFLCFTFFVFLMHLFLNCICLACIVVILCVFVYLISSYQVYLKLLLHASHVALPT